MLAIFLLVLVTEVVLQNFRIPLELFQSNRLTANVLSLTDV